MKTKMPYAKALSIANTLIARFQPDCERIELAGSIRRGKAEIGDIEILAVPKPSLYTRLDALIEDGKIRHNTPKRWGEKLRSFLMTVGDNEVQVDLFLQPDPATYGVNMMIRTGSSDFSRRMVTDRLIGGWKPSHISVKEARVWIDGAAQETPEEGDVFALWGMAMPEPHQRTDEYKPVWLKNATSTPAPVHSVVKPKTPKPTTLDPIPPILEPDRLAQILATSAAWPIPKFGGRDGAREAARAAIEKSTVRKV